MGRLDGLRRAVGAEEDAGAATRSARVGYTAALAAGALAACIPVGAALFLATVEAPVIAGFSTLFAGLIILPLAGRPRFSREDRPRLVAIGLIGASLAPTAFFLGLRGTTASEASVLVNAETVFTITLAVTILRERASAREFAAVAVVVAGALALSLARDVAFEPAHLLANGLIVLSTLGWATDNIISTGLARRNAPHSIAAWKNLVGAPAAFGLALLLGSSFALSWQQLGGLFLVGGIGIGVSLVLFYVSLRHIGAYRTSAIFGLQGAFGSALGYYLVGDRLAPGQLAGAAAMVGGVLMLAWAHRSQGPSRGADAPPPVVPP
jgi:drug/metabolite transporter (DMT)-like permease